MMEPDKIKYLRKHLLDLCANNKCPEHKNCDICMYNYCVKDTLEEISNTIEGIIYWKQEEYGADIVEMYPEIVEELQDFIIKRLKEYE